MMVLYGTTLVFLVKELRDSDLGLLTPFYAYNAELHGSAQRNARLMKLLLEWGQDWGYFPYMYKSLFIVESPNQEVATQKEFEEEGIEIIFSEKVLPGGLYGV